MLIAQIALSSGKLCCTLQQGYVYDSLPEVPPQQIQAPPVWAVFRGVDVAGRQLAKSSYTLFVFVLPKGTEAQWLPPMDPALVMQAHGLAGIATVFGGRGEKCDNCVRRRKPITLRVNITQALLDLGLNR